MDFSDQSERMLSFFNLKYDPFGALVDTMVYSGAGGRYETVETIRHLLTYSPQDSLVTGLPGSGKRTLAQQVIKRLEDHWRVAWLDGNELQSQEDALREIIGQFGLGLKVDQDPESLLQKIVQLTEQAAAEEQSFLIVVQHAEELIPEIESMLLAVRSLPDVIDFRIRQLWLGTGASDLTVPLDEEDWYIHPLAALKDQEAELYLRDRLAAAGSVSSFPIEEQDVARLNQLAGGLPAQLNEYARDYLISGTFKVTEKKQSFPLPHLIAGTAAVCLVVIAFLYQSNEQPQTVLTLQPADAGGAQEMTAIEKRLAEAVAKVEAKQQTETPATAENVPAENESQPETNTTVMLPATETATTAVATEGSEPPLAAAADEEQSPTATQEGNASLLNSADDGSYTLQLIGVRDRSKLAELIAEFSDPRQVDIVSTVHQGEPWYVLIYGQFSSRSAAQTAIAGLPESFADSEPWIRSFASVRTEAN